MAGEFWSGGGPLYSTGRDYIEFLQMLLHGAQFLGWFYGPMYGLLVGLGPTVVFIAMMIWSLGLFVIAAVRRLIRSVKRHTGCCSRRK